MDPKEFRQRLETIAELKDCKPARNSGERINLEVTEVTLNGELVEIDQEFNPTLGFELVKLKDSVKICELGCGKVVVNQKIEQRYYVNPEPHWKTKCTNCGCFLSPDGKEFIKNSNLAQNIFRAHFTNAK